MAQRPKELTPNAGPWHRWGYDLRGIREARDVSLGALGAAAHVNASHLARLERAERPVPRHIAVAVDEALNAGGSLVRGWELANLAEPQGGPGARRSGTRAVSRDAARGHVANPGVHVASAPDALALNTFGQAGSDADDTDTVVVPCRIDGRIRFVPVPRRTVLASGLAGLAVAALPTPAVAASPVNGGSPAEVFAQLRRTLIQQDNLMGPRHVLPAVQHRLAGLTAQRKAARGADAARLLELETRYEELAGWLAQDIGDERTATGHTARALDASHITGDGDLTAYILGRKAQLAADTGHPHDALGLANAARRTAKPGSKLEVIAVMHQAHGNALLGDEAASLSGYDTALDLLDRAADDGVWGSWLDTAYVHTARSRSLAALGHYEQAVTGFRSAIGALPPAYRRDRGVYLAREARALAGAGDHQQAAHTGLEAVQIAAETGSARIVEQLDKLDAALAHTPREQGVPEFRSALDQIVLHPQT
ncbi:helix-turn-helix domain-containing protein [Streptomyces sp. Da 82-17]|uniref:helix-turn-helix domain-containing protein n=1 Tax=Streptomyces sp. Da 82-17 TaxID=3377116 RepID=UPI0038D38824